MLRIQFNKSNYLKTVILFIVLYVSNDTILFGTNINREYFFTKIDIIFTLIICLVVYFVFKKIKFRLNSIILLFVLLFCIVATGIVNGDLSNFNYQYRIFIIISSFILVHYISMEEFVVAFRRILILICLFSMTTFILEIIQVDLFNNLPTVTNTSFYTFYNLGLSFINKYNVVPRNYGFFREPAIFQMFIIIALIFELFYKSSNNFKVILLFIITIISTRSTTGFIALFIIMVTYILNYNKSVKFNLSKIWLSITLIFGFFYLFFSTNILYDSEGIGSVFGKLNSQSGSFISRLASISNNIRMFFMNPIFGIGVTKSNYYFPILTQKYYGLNIEHNTNYALVQFSTYGILFGLIWNYGFLLFSRVISKKKYLNVIIFITLNVLFIGSDVSTNITISMLMLYGYMNYKNKSNMAQITKY